MSGKQYLKNQLPVLLLNLLGVLALALFLIATGTSRQAISFIALVWIVVVVCYLTVSFFIQKRHCETLLVMAEQLGEKYLMPEVMAMPERADEQVFYQILKMAEKSMLEKIGEIQSERQEYKEYIEQWIHEVKTPITAMKLICENNRSEFTRELLVEVENINHFTEQALYYARSEHTEKDYTVREIRIRDVVHDAIADSKYLLRKNHVTVEVEDDGKIAYMQPILKLEHIQKYYGNEGNITKAIRDISFSVEAGEFLGIMGASGSGKTTLLNCISTIDTVSAGHIYLGGTDVTEIKPKAIARFRRENLGFVFQDFNLLDTLTISENIALALSINKTPARDVEPRIQDIAQKLNITDILNKYPYQVSGGQKQRCACARAIINNPKLLLADEPTGALDSHSAQMLLSTIQSINEQLSATILMVTHDAFTASYASRILFLQDGAIFTELRKGNDSRSAFFEKILNVLTMIGGGQSHVC